MLNVILLILKIIGITIAVILGVLLFVILLVLFVPLRYRVKAKKGEETEGNGRVSWLFGIIYFKIEYVGKKTAYVLRIFGYSILSSNPKRKRRKRIKKKKKVPKKAPAKKETVIAKTEPEVLKEPEVFEEREVIEEDIEEDKEEIGQSDHEIVAPKKPKEPKSTFFDKIKQFFSKFTKIGEKLRGIKQKIRDMLTLIKGYHTKFGLVKDFLLDSKNKPGFRQLWRAVKRILKHSSPLKMKINLHFGFDDPAQTGQLLGAICAIYPQILGKVNLMPDFNQKVFEGDLYVRGRIRAINVIVIVVQLILNKEFKTVIKEAKQLKEEL